jgi:choline kinase
MKSMDSPRRGSQRIKCVILAAGLATRLRPLTDSVPKCLLDVNGKTLLERSLECLTARGINEIAVVVGYHAEMVREFVKRHFPRVRISFIFNPNYASTNNAYSLLLSRDFIEGRRGAPCRGMLLVDGDLFFTGEMLDYFLKDEEKNKISFSTGSAYGDEEVKVTIDPVKNIVRIGKEIKGPEIQGESIGMAMFSKETAIRMFGIIERRVKEGPGRTEFYETAIQELINSGEKISAIDVSRWPAIEIDTYEDLERTVRISRDIP